MISLQWFLLGKQLLEFWKSETSINIGNTEKIQNVARQYRAVNKYGSFLFSSIDQHKHRATFLAQIQREQVRFTKAEVPLFVGTWHPEKFPQYRCNKDYSNLDVKPFVCHFVRQGKQ